MTSRDEARGFGGMRTCKICGHVFFAHGPKGCRSCDCTDVRGGVFGPTTPTKDIVRVLRESARKRARDGSS